MSTPFPKNIPFKDSRAEKEGFLTFLATGLIGPFNAWMICNRSAFGKFKPNFYLEQQNYQSKIIPCDRYEKKYNGRPKNYGISY